MSKAGFVERINRVVQFIEMNLDSEINVSKLSEIACYSEYHFHRLFRSYAGESVYGYRKRLLLERAVKHLLYSNENITEIAFKCGYENQSSFNKAFKNQFSCSPSQVRKQMVSIDIGKVNLFKEWSVAMKPEIIELDEIKTICVRKTGSYAEASAEAWGQLMKFAYSNKLMKNNVRRIGISHDDPNVTKPNLIRYDACIDVEVNVDPDIGLQEKVISGGKYAKFLHKGAYDKLQDTYAYIFNAWLPESDYELQDKPCFDIYLNKDPRRTKPENLRTEIYIPIM